MCAVSKSSKWLETDQLLSFVGENQLIFIMGLTKSVLVSCHRLHFSEQLLWAFARIYPGSGWFQLLPTVIQPGYVSILFTLLITYSLISEANLHDLSIPPTFFIKFRFRLIVRLVHNLLLNGPHLNEIYYIYIYIYSRILAHLLRKPHFRTNLLKLVGAGGLCRSPSVSLRRWSAKCKYTGYWGSMSTQNLLVENID